jgi:hypothetical protein
MAVKQKSILDDLKCRLDDVLDDYEWHRKKLIFLEEQISQLKHTITELEKG